MTATVGEAVQRAVAALRGAEALIITAGAGLGCDSGLPAFRTPDGFWRAYPPMRKLNLHFSEMSNPQWFERDPTLAWGFFGHRFNLYKAAVPHDGFRILREIGARMPKGYFVVTSNVDGHFQKAAFDESRILEVHGTIHHLQCTSPFSECASKIWPVPADMNVDVDKESFRAAEPLPKCIHCKKALSRPNILMFDDMTWQSDRTDDQRVRYDAFLRGLGDTPTAVVEIGAGTAVITIRRTSERLARELRGRSTLIRINPDEPKIDVYGDHHVSLPLGALDALRRIEEGLTARA